MVRFSIKKIKNQNHHHNCFWLWILILITASAIQIISAITVETRGGTESNIISRTTTTAKTTTTTKPIPIKTTSTSTTRTTTTAVADDNAIKKPTIQNKQLLFTEQEIVENLVKQWAPLVWLAPGEQFMPGDVNEFLKNVHAEKSKNKFNIKFNNNNNDGHDDGNNNIVDDGDDDDQEQHLTEYDLINYNLEKMQYYYDIDNELSSIFKLPNKWLFKNDQRRQHPQNQQQQQQQRMARKEFKTIKRNDNEFLIDYIINLPIGSQSRNWNLVTNTEIENLLKDQSSFIYGKNPNKSNVPIYAMVKMCGGVTAGATAAGPSYGSSRTSTNFNDIIYNPRFIDNNNNNNKIMKKNPYIPVTIPTISQLEINSPTAEIVQRRQYQKPITIKDKFEIDLMNNPSIINTDQSRRHLHINDEISLNRQKNITVIINGNRQFNPRSIRKRRRRKRDSSSLSSVSASAQESINFGNLNQHSIQDEIDNNIDITNYLDKNEINNYYINSNDNRDSSSSSSSSSTSNVNDENIQKYPHFHVTYWMFYPYSQGKPICTVSLGPLGHLPIPLIFGMCLGKRRDFGSHVGDWEHMSLYFRGGKEPDEMYVSAHDAGAYYSYEKLTGTFDFRSQETRKGIIQRPTFPKTVVTSKNHPVLFSAHGSHGLWTAPGKHRFVRVPRLFDVNGFGTPWSTWKLIDISYSIGGSNPVVTRADRWKNVQRQRSTSTSNTMGNTNNENNNNNKNNNNGGAAEWLHFNGRWGNPKSKCHPLTKIGLHFCEYIDGPTGIPLKKPHFQCT